MKNALIILSTITLYGLAFWGTMSCNSTSANEIKNLENSGLPAAVIQSITAQAASAKGEPGTITILIDGTEYLVEVQQTAVNESAEAIPMCSAKTCQEEQAKIERVCKNEGWPPGHLVLVCNVSTGNCCNCTCP